MIGAAEPGFDILGKPTGAESLRFEVAGTDSPGIALIAIASELAADAGSGWEIDPTSLQLLLGPFTIDSAGWSLDLGVPTDPALDGILLHVQGLTIEAGPSTTFTNKVSIRLAQD